MSEYVPRAILASLRASKGWNAILLSSRLLLLRFLCNWLLDITPLVDSVEVLELIIEGATSIDLVIWNLLHEDTLDVRGG